MARPGTASNSRKTGIREPIAYRFEPRAARRAIGFIETFCVHTKGEWAGKRFMLQPWQERDIVAPLFGWLRGDGRRRYRTAFVELPRKNGKSTMCSALALYLLYADGEPGAEVYSAAADTNQARIVFEQAKRMVELSPALRKRAKIFRDAISLPQTGSVYRVLSADAPTKHGLNASGIIFDELHAQPGRDLYDVLNTSTGARRQPLLIAITTAGFDRLSVCWELHELSANVLRDPALAPSHFAYIAAAGENDDWTSPAVWRAANPGYNVTVSADYLAEQAKQAEQIPAYQNTFRRLHLNQWTQQADRWLDLALWDACREPEPVELAGRPCYAGLDLASTNDLAALALCFPPVTPGEPYRLRWHFWIPGDGMFERARRHHVPYLEWYQAGFLHATPGDTVDFAAILEQITALGKRYRILEIAFDRWGATLISQQLTERRFQMVEFGQGFASMASPTAALGKMVSERGIAHDGHPVARWNADNVTVAQDAAGNLKPDKGKSREKIDGIVAAIMALDRALRNERKPSVYESRGVVDI